MEELKIKVTELWHIAHTAVGNSRYDRMQYIKKWLLQDHMDIIIANFPPYSSADTAKYSNKKLWLFIEDCLA